MGKHLQMSIFTVSFSVRYKVSQQDVMFPGIFVLVCQSFAWEKIALEIEKKMRLRPSTVKQMVNA